MLYGGQVNVKRSACPVLKIGSDADAQAAYDAFEKEFSEAFSPFVVNRPGGVYLENFVLRVTVPVKKPPIPEYPLQGKDASAARTGTRECYWRELGKSTPTTIYQFEKLQPGNELSGPAVVEAELTTVVVPPGRRFHIDKHRLGIMEYLPGENPAEKAKAAVKRKKAVAA